MLLETFNHNVTEVYSSYVIENMPPTAATCDINPESVGCQLGYNYPTASVNFDNPNDPVNCTNYYNVNPIDPPKCLGLLNDMQYMAKFSAFKPIITAGIFAATLSSALTSLVSAPKIFQALCKDELFPGIKWFAKGYGDNDDPRRAFVLTFAVSIGFIMIGDLNTIAPIISNFFLASYCLINWSCFMASLSGTPGWRPAFKYYNKWVSLLGAVCCGAIMFVISAISGFITILIIMFLYLLISYRQSHAKAGKGPVNWGSSNQGYAYKHALDNTLKLENIKFHVKNFRPGTLVLCGDPRDRLSLVYLANCFTKETSLMICGNIIGVRGFPR